MTDWGGVTPTLIVLLFWEGSDVSDVFGEPARLACMSQPLKKSAIIIVRPALRRPPCCVADARVT